MIEKNRNNTRKNSIMKRKRSERDYYLRMNPALKNNFYLVRTTLECQRLIITNWKRLSYYITYI